MWEFKNLFFCNHSPSLLSLSPSYLSPSLPLSLLPLSLGHQNDPDEGYGSAQGADSVMAHKQRKHDAGRSLGWYRRQEYIILVTGIITMIIGLSLTILASLKISQFNEATASGVGVAAAGGYITLADGSLVAAPENAGGNNGGGANFDSQTHCSCAVAEDPARGGRGGGVIGGGGTAGETDGVQLQDTR